ncbi:MAG TPA: F420-dependent methylenetetrahydromethanopterin dehydrogenase, partial [Candidatus Lokiarchaeia archaeon]|nr:F420-dependent methylenetetrahydromethanopterin dehydrogenase [Candidatus Lokiarchaeia archaeon]
MAETRVVKIGVVKNGNLGACPVLDLIFDERADRDDVDFRVLGSGAKLGQVQCVETMEKMLAFQPELILMISPNAALPGPKEGRDMIQGIPTIVYSDMPAKKAVEELEAKGMGYILCAADSMIGARRPFLDGVEMSLFNANLLTVLSITGVINCIQDEVEKAI